MLAIQIEFEIQILISRQSQGRNQGTRLETNTTEQHIIHNNDAMYIFLD